MSRGLGRFQRNIKAMIYAMDEVWRKECARVEGTDEAPDADCQFWLTWPQIKDAIKDIKGLDPTDKLRPSFERSLKRALYGLVKRGEIGKLPGMHGGPICYITKETYDESFSPEATRKLGEAMARLAAKGESK